MSISHAKRKNVVTGTLYGQLQNRVCKELNVDMVPLGLPTEAMSWNGMGFHWMQQAHATVGGQSKNGLMPTIYLGKLGETAPIAAKPAAKPTAKPAAKSAGAGEELAIALVASSGTAKEFILKAVKVPEIASNEALMNQCLDDSPTGFYKTHKGK
jgi:hypothetical protein